MVILIFVPLSVHLRYLQITYLVIASRIAAWLWYSTFAFGLEGVDPESLDCFAMLAMTIK